MRHFPFLKALAESDGVRAPVWRDASAGYLVLRFFDWWLQEGPAALASDLSLARVREQILIIPDERARELLLSVVHRMTDAVEADPTVVSEPLLGYGKYLEATGRPILAADVYKTLISEFDLQEPKNPLPVATVLMQYGYVTRFLGDLDASAEAYHQAGTLAHRAGARCIALRAEIGAANTLKTRGNLGDAETLLDGVITEAAVTKMSAVESWARHARASVRELRGQYRDALVDFTRAHDLTDDAGEREFILSDLAGCAWDIGDRRTAVDAFRTLAYTAREPLVRSAALANLLEVAALDGTANEFEHAQTQLAAHVWKYPLPREYAVHVALYTAYGIERFSPTIAAIAAYHSVIADARRAGIHQIAFKAEERLTALVKGPHHPRM